MNWIPTERCIESAKLATRFIYFLLPKFILHVNYREYWFSVSCDITSDAAGIIKCSHFIARSRSFRSKHIRIDPSFFLTTRRELTQSVGSSCLVIIPNSSISWSFDFSFGITDNGTRRVAWITGGTHLSTTTWCLPGMHPMPLKTSSYFWSYPWTEDTSSMRWMRFICKQPGKLIAPFGTTTWNIRECIWLRCTTDNVTIPLSEISFTINRQYLACSSDGQLILQSWRYTMTWH